MLFFFGQLSQSWDNGVGPVVHFFLGHFFRQGVCLCQFGDARRGCEQTSGRPQVCTRRESAGVHAQTGLNASGFCSGAFAVDEK